MKTLDFALAAALALALGACGNDRKADQAEARGDVLPRSVSDDMLPYDTVQSMPSLAPYEATTPADRPREQPSGAADGNADVVVDAEPEAAE